MKRIVPAVLATLLLAAVPTHAQLSNPDASTPTTLYFHIFDTFNPFPINTQPMNVSFFEVGGTSFPTVSHPIVTQAAGDYNFNTVYGFATSGPVEYDFIENGRPRYHPERGIAADVNIDKDVRPTVYLYMDVRDLFSTDSSNGREILGEDWKGLPNAIPSFTFRFEMRTGNSLRTEELDAGTPIMSGSKTAYVIDGQTVPVTGVPSEVGGQQVLSPDANGIIEWAIPLDFAGTPVIPKADAFHVRLDWYQNPTPDSGNDDSLATGYMRLVSDPQHLPRLQMAIKNPVYIEYIHPQVAAGLLLIHSCVNSPWGTYDVDVANITVGVTGPTAPQTLAQVISQNSHVHGLHDRCAEVTYLWRFRDEDAKNGDYGIHLTVPNLAKSSTASGDAGFTVEGKSAFGTDENGDVVETAGKDNAGKSSPLAVGPLVGVGLLGFAALLRRRQA